ncbi:Histidine kinase [Quadrisphaera granulorum]|uniref:Histidine kinase n=1 Tax=Quadrisphaera granulorum TaxID=317664 RepID=A0A315ZU39_9ACTN|nr:GAF domain-containing sensor histidine kinase [Quadrisphaera granulorum]PWJ48839.1 histidine kinase [Quadrisphaera granulorum]SZE98321.1 Histidine kinase [Quadrisphaera granulorum]
MEARLRRLLDAVVAINDLDLDAVLQGLLQAATDLVGARYGALGVISADGRGLDRFVHTGMDPEVAASLGHLPEGRGVLGRLIADPRPLRVDDLTADPQAVGFPPGHPPMRSFLGVPVVVRGEVFGNLYLTEKFPDRDAGCFTREDSEVAQALAAIAGTALANAALHTDAQRLAVLEDRDRIAHDLHDHVIQRLFAAGLSLQALNARLHRPDEEEVRTRLAGVVSQLDEVVRDIRTTIFGLHTSPGSDGGLRRQLLTVVEEFTGRAATTVRTTGAVDVLVTGTLATDVIAVVREGTSNAVRHGRAAHLVVTVDATATDPASGADAVVVQVDDDGVGIEAGAARSGLAGLEQRAERRGGTFEVRQRPEGGTRLLWSAPLDAVVAAG